MSFLFLEVARGGLDTKKEEIGGEIGGEERDKPVEMEGGCWSLLDLDGAILETTTKGSVLSIFLGTLVQMPGSLMDV